MSPAIAAERHLSLSSFERLRVEGPFVVTLTVGGSPGGTVKGDARAIEAVEVRQDGATVVVRAAPDEARDTRTQDDAPPRAIALTTPSLVGAAVIGGGRLSVVGGRMRRLDLSVTGPGAITLAGAQAEQMTALVIGNGTMTLAGRAASVRLSVNGAGGIAADTLDAGDLVVRLDGPGEIAARARYTATITNVGLGHVAVAGSAKCVTKSGGGGPVTCGAGR